MIRRKRGIIVKIDVEINDETGIVEEKDIDIVSNLLSKAAELEQLEGEFEVSVTFVDNERIQEINREYRDKDQVTDVISFAMNEVGEEEMEIIGLEGPNVLGDIIISIPKAEEQAKTYQHSFQRELGFLAVHGFLHLLGYDHMTMEEEERMFSRQEDILSAYGLKR